MKNFVKGTTYSILVRQCMQEPAELRRKSLNYRLQMRTLNTIALALVELSEYQFQTFQFLKLCYCAVISQCQFFIGFLRRRR
jgi:hypothetical protein